MNSRVGRLGGHSHDSRNLTFLFRSREATTHRVYLNEVDTPLWVNVLRERSGRLRCVQQPEPVFAKDLLDALLAVAPLDKGFGEAGIASGVEVN